MTQFKFSILLFLFLSFFLYLRLRNWFTVFFMASIFSLQFFNPNKYYTVEVIRSYEILLQQFRDGYFLGYGVNISNIFLFASFIFFLKYFFSTTQLRRHAKLFFYQIPFLIFFVIGVKSSRMFSFSLPASLVWLLQYLQVALYSSMLPFIFLQKSGKKLFFLTLISIVIFQAFISFQQFFHQSYLGIVIENGQGTSFYTGLDENNAIFRIAGTFLFHNQFAFIMLLLFSILFPMVLVSRSSVSKFYQLSVFIAFILITLSQSRSVWIAFFSNFILLFFLMRKNILNFIQFIIRSEFILKLSPIIFLLSFIIFPRILLSVNTFYVGAGVPVRIDMIKEGVEALSNQFLFGYGIGTNEYILHSFFPNGVMSVFPAAIHMGFLQLALEVGIFGLLLFLTPFYLVLRSLLSKKIHPYQTGTISYILCLCDVIIYYMFQPHVGIVDFAFLGMFLGMGIYSLNSDAE